MKRILVAVGLAACTPGADPVDPPVDELPAGVWEPVPGAWIWDASQAAENGTVWWTYTQHVRQTDGFGDTNDVWLTATSATGERQVAPSGVDPGSDAIWSPQVAVTPSAVIVMTRGNSSVISRFDRSGSRLGAPTPITIDDGGRAATIGNTIDLVATPDGGAQLVAALFSETAEVAIVDLDAAGATTRTVLLGPPDTTEPGGTAPNIVAAAPRADGSTIVAWDHHYNGCISTRPSATLTAPFDGTNVGAIQAVGDLPDRSEYLPAVAAAGSTAYIVWQSYSAGLPFSLAKYPDVGTVLAEVGDRNEESSAVTITLSAPGRGVISWNTYDAGRLNVVAFTESGGTVSFGSPHVVTAVNPLFGMTSTGLVHVGADRYVLGWIERRGASDEARLYATELDLANDALRPAPPVEARPPVPGMPQRALHCP